MSKRIKKILCVVWGLILTTDVHSALVEGNVLRIDPGSRFGMEVSPGTMLYTPITGVNGIHLGSAQPPGNSPYPVIGDSIDYYEFLGGSARDYTLLPTQVLSSSGNTATVDFSGWTTVVDTYGAIDMGAGATAYVSCAVDCAIGDSYNLIYDSYIPLGHPSGFGGVQVQWELTGYVVPLPAAVWLFVSGLAGLFIVNGRQRKYMER